MELLIDSRHGVYIPQQFASLVLSGAIVVNFPQIRTFLGDLGNPENEGYWEAWDEVLSRAQVMRPEGVYTLYQEEDLFLLSDSEEIPE